MATTVARNKYGLTPQEVKATDSFIANLGHAPAARLQQLIDQVKGSREQVALLKQRLATCGTGDYRDAAVGDGPGWFRPYLQRMVNSGAYVLALSPGTQVEIGTYSLAYGVTSPFTAVGAPQRLGYSEFSTALNACQNAVFGDATKPPVANDTFSATATVDLGITPFPRTAAGTARSANRGRTFGGRLRIGDNQFTAQPGALSIAVGLVQPTTGAQDNILPNYIFNVYFQKYPVDVVFLLISNSGGMAGIVGTDLHQINDSGGGAVADTTFGALIANSAGATVLGASSGVVAGSTRATLSPLNMRDLLTLGRSFADVRNDDRFTDG